jgi:hypothetical protein
MRYAAHYQSTGLPGATPAGRTSITRHRSGYCRQDPSPARYRRAWAHPVGRKLHHKGRHRVEQPRRLSIVVGFYRVCVLDGLLPHSPADYVRRPTVPAESPTLGLGHLQFEALLTTARLSTTRMTSRWSQCSDCLVCGSSKPAAATSATWVRNAQAEPGSRPVDQLAGVATIGPHQLDGGKDRTDEPHQGVAGSTVLDPGGQGSRPPDREQLGP